MNLSGKGAVASDSKLTTLNTTSLNPHAAEFVPFALQSSSRTVSSAESSFKGATSANVTSGKGVLDRSESSASNNSDDEVRQFWRQQLPDDITPDFNAVVEDESQRFNNLSLSGLTISPPLVGGYRFNDGVRSPLLYGDEQITNNGQLIANVTDGSQFNGDPGHGFLPDLQMDYTDVNHLEYLSSQFPGFSAESLGEVYFANGGDLNITIEILTQLELQIDGGLNRNGSSKAMSSPNLSALDFPALSAAEGQNEMHQLGNSFRPSDKDNMLLFRSSSSLSPRGQIDFASAVRKMATQDSGIWKYDRNGGSGASVGSSRSSHMLQPGASSRAPPVWLKTGEAVANMYSEVREDARDHARLRNAYFEQARQAYLIGNKALAKELSAKGQLHNMQMKAAHAKAQESIYRQRNPGGQGIQIKGSGQERIIDLHGLHVNEAIHVLKRELSVLRNVAQSGDQRLQVYICVGTGHHTRGSRTPVRLPIAVQRYLLEEECLDFSEPQPGLLRVVLY